MRSTSRRRTDWQRVLATVEGAHGRLDGLVNAAGIALLATIEDTELRPGAA